jgi:flagellar basal-body rod protein FlgC
VQVKQMVESAAPPRIAYDPKNPAANADGYVQLPNVDVVEEMVNMISASRSYQTNTEVMTTAKTLAERTLTMGQN